MVCQTEEFAQIMAKNGNRVYRYFYNHQSSKGQKKQKISYMQRHIYVFGICTCTPPNFDEKFQRIASKYGKSFRQEQTLKLGGVYIYIFFWIFFIDPWPTWSGSKHGDELEFTFGLPLKKPKEYSAQEIKFTRDIITYWTNFVKNG